MLLVNWILRGRFRSAAQGQRQLWEQRPMSTDSLQRLASPGRGWGRTAVLLAAFALLWSTSGAHAEQPAAYMQRVTNDLLAASRTGSLGRPPPAASPPT